MSLPQDPTGLPVGDPRRLCVRATLSTREAMRRLDQEGKRILAVVDEDGRLFGVVSDGDLRRWILKEGDLEAPVSEVCNRRPITVPSGHPAAEIRRIFRDTGIIAIVELGGDGRVRDFHFWTDLAREPEPEPRRRKLERCSAVIMAGGAGTRLDPFTRIMPKPLIPLGDKPVIEHILAGLRAQGLTVFHVLAHHRAEMLRAWFEGNPTQECDLRLVVEPTPLGTAGGLALLPLEELEETVLVSNCDILVRADLAEALDHHREGGYPMTLVAVRRAMEIPYGILTLTPDERALASIEEKPSREHLVNTGVYLLEKRLLAGIPAGERLDMTDLIARLLSAGEPIGVHPIPSDAWLDTGQWGEYLDTRARLVRGG